VTRFVWGGGKDWAVLRVKFGGLLPIAGFAMVYDPKARRWRFSRNTVSVAVQVGPLIYDEEGNVLAPEAYTYEDIKADHAQVVRLGLVGVGGVVDEQDFVEEDELLELGEAHPVVTLYNHFFPNRVSRVRTGCRVDRGEAWRLACNAVVVSTTDLVAFFYQNWIDEVTEVLFAFNPEYSGVPEDEGAQREHLVQSMKHLLIAYQFRVAIPSEDIRRVEDPEVVPGDRVREVLREAFPRPWWVAAWSPKERRGSGEFLSFWRDLTLSMYDFERDLVPKPLRRLGRPRFDLSGLISGWGVDASSPEAAVESVLREFYSRVSVSDSEVRRDPVGVLESGRAHPFDAANTICEILRQVDRVFGAGWGGGGLPAKACVLDDRAGFKVYLPDKDEWVLTEVGKGFGEYSPYSKKVEYFLIP